jgi:hypothetical protein
MSTLPVQTQKTNAIFPYLAKEGGLHFEYNQRKKDVLIEILGEVHKAALVMGITLDGERSAITTQEAVKKILDVYPTAWVKDIKKALEMASYGIIKLPNQLNTISASNIFQWYKELRLNHPEKIGEQVQANSVETEMTPEQKYTLMVNAFTDFLTAKPHDQQLQTLYYDRLFKLGYIPITDERKVEMMVQEIERLLDHYPQDIFCNGYLRKEANMFKNYYRELCEPKKINWGAWYDNPIVRKARDIIKSKLVLEVLDFIDTDQMITDYKIQIADELQIAI